MTTMFNEREQAFEAKFAHDAEVEFMVRTRGGALFASWIANLLGLNAMEAATKAGQMISAVMNGQNDRAILTDIANELQDRGQSVSPMMLASRLVECREEARAALHS